MILPCLWIDSPVVWWDVSVTVNELTREILNPMFGDRRCAKSGSTGVQTAKAMTDSE